MVNLSYEEFAELITQQGQPQEKANLEEGLYHTRYETQIHTSLCRGQATNVSIREGINLLKVELTFFKDTTIEMKSVLPQVGFAYCLKGQVKGFRQNTLPRAESELSYLFSTRTAMVYATAASHGWMQLDQDKPYKALYLLFSNEAFSQLVGDQLQAMPAEFLQALQDENGYYINFSKISSQVVALADAIFDNPYEGKSREFFREAKVIELLAYQVDALSKPQPEIDSTGVRLTLEEEKLLERCHEMLLSSLQNPPSLIDLARQMKMSDYRLKQGFRQKYGMTPFRFVVDERMLQAKALLQQGGLSVGEVAAAVGFTSLGTFSNSFYEKYGIRPSELQ